MQQLLSVHVQASRVVCTALMVSDIIWRAYPKDSCSFHYVNIHCPVTYVRHLQGGIRKSRTAERLRDVAMDRKGSSSNKRRSS